LSAENEQNYEDNEYKCHSEEDGIKLGNSWADILDSEESISITSKQRRHTYLETGNKGLAFPVYPLDSVTHFFLADISIPIFIKKGKSCMLWTVVETPHSTDNNNKNSRPQRSTGSKEQNL
jgi:hypothetical protein